GAVAGRLRLDVLDAWLTRNRLRHPWQSDHGARDRDGGDRKDSTAGLGARGVAALTARVREVEAGLGSGVLGGARALTELVPLAVVLALLAPRLALCAVAVLAAFALGLSVVRRAWKRMNARAAHANDALLEAADEAVRHADLWTTFGAERKVR